MTWLARLLDLLPLRWQLWNDVGLLLHAQRRYRLAQLAFQEALRRSPDSALVLSNLAMAERDLGRINRAEALCRRALQLQPQFAEALNNLGGILEKKEQFQEALDCYGEAAAAHPGFGIARLNRAALLQKLGREQEAASGYDELLSTQEMPEARFNRSLSLLRAGAWLQGWPDYEVRFQRSARSKRELEPPLAGVPRWHGEALAGKRILLRSEQGLGDVVQFARFASMLKGKGASVFLSVHPILVALLQTADGVETVCARGHEAGLAPMDWWTPMLSLGGLLGITEANIPREVPYLHPPPALIAARAKRLPDEPGKRRVGLACAGNAQHENDRYRSMHSADLAPLADPRVDYFGLGTEPAPPSAAVIGLRPLGRFRDFLELAAVIASLDLVITVDTVFAHLAGALARPVWLLLPFNSDWRWLRERGDSPWYPTMRLYRQPRLGDWSDVIARVALDLRA